MKVRNGTHKLVIWWHIIPVPPSVCSYPWFAVSFCCGKQQCHSNNRDCDLVKIHSSCPVGWCSTGVLHVCWNTKDSFSLQLQSFQGIHKVSNMQVCWCLVLLNFKCTTSGSIQNSGFSISPYVTLSVKTVFETAAPDNWNILRKSTRSRHDTYNYSARPKLKCEIPHCDLKLVAF